MRPRHAGETAWALDLPRAGIAVEADSVRNLLFVERVRRVNLAATRPALNGYQRGRSFYCRAAMPLITADVDHFFPWILRERREMPDADGIWNLVLACRRRNRGEQGKFAAVPASALVARLHERNEWLIESHHPLRETIMLQTGTDREAGASFLRARQRIALDALIHEWHYLADDLLLRPGCCDALSAARTGSMPSTSRNLSGSASMTSNTFSPNALTIFLA
jgi:hypothetical protein